MAFDFKKAEKAFYLPKTRPEIVTIPAMNYLAIRGHGDPNQEGGTYSQAISMLYAVAYTLKMSYKTPYKIEGFFEYIVPPLEGFWWQENRSGINYGNKSDFHWIAVLRLPDFISPVNVAWAKVEVERKKNFSCKAVEFLTIDEGLCVQMLHIGTYDDEPVTVAAMDAFVQQTGYQNDLSNTRFHHEIYLSDPRRTPPEKRKTVIRHPIRNKNALFSHSLAKPLPSNGHPNGGNTCNGINLYRLLAICTASGCPCSCKIFLSGRTDPLALH